MHVQTKTGAIEIPDVEPVRPHPEEMLGLAIETLRLVPINGLRYPVTEGSCGWYIWGGPEHSQAADFFSPVHVLHVSDYVTNIAPYLDLPPGYRFLINKDGTSDIWFDENLVKV